MGRCSNIILGILNGLGLIIGIAIIAFALHVRHHSEMACMKLLQHPLLVAGVLLTVFSLVGFIGTCCKSGFCLSIYNILLAIWFVGLVVSAACMFYVARSSPKTQEQAQNSWVQSFYLVGKHWPAVKNCFVEGNLCQNMLSEAESLNKELQKEKTRGHHILDGCCKPPEDCGFEFQNGTVWTAPKTGLVKKGGDCMVWNNEPDALCYDCDRCKQAFVGDLRKEAMFFGIGITFELVLVVIIFSLGHCAKRN